MHFIVLCAFFFVNGGLCSMKELEIVNQCPFTVWPVVKSSSAVDQSKLRIQKDLQLREWESLNISVSANWSGQIWGKTKCPDNGICETGGCIDNTTRENICKGISLPPVTTANFHFGRFPAEKEEDFYSVSLLAGYNIPIQVRPLYQSLVKNTNQRYDCNIAGCFRNVNSVCPEKLLKRNRHGIIIGCKWEPSLDTYSIFIEACPDTIIFNNFSTTVSKKSFSDSAFSCKIRYHEDSKYQLLFCP